MASIRGGHYGRPPIMAIPMEETWITHVHQSGATETLAREIKHSLPDLYCAFKLDNLLFLCVEPDALGYAVVRIDPRTQLPPPGVDQEIAVEGWWCRTLWFDVYAEESCVQHITAVLLQAPRETDRHVTVRLQRAPSDGLVEVRIGDSR